MSRAWDDLGGRRPEPDELELADDHAVVVAVFRPELIEHRADDPTARPRPTDRGRAVIAEIRSMLRTA